LIARALAAVLLTAAAAPAAAASLGVEASTDLRRRGLSWSDGKPAIEAWASVPVTGVLSIEGGAATLRGSARHGGADVLAEAALRYTRQSGAFSWWADVQGLGFVGASGQDYGQLRTGAAFGIGPVQLSGIASWAPPQAAIGGSNVYVGGSINLGIPLTPLTLRASAGHSTGTDDGSGRASRLRPGGDYSDVRFDADYVLGPVTLGASFTTTTIDHDADVPRRFADNAGTRVLLRAGVAF
jgi:Bacterial protein of unknown function (Gcw_chp)